MENMTDEQKAEAKEALKAAWEMIKTKAIDLGDDDLTKALTLVRPSLFGARGGFTRTNTIGSKFNGMFPEVGSKVSELDIFQELKSGRKECTILIRNLIKDVEPADRKWVVFDAAEGVYECIAVGADAPEGWSGYNPVD